MRWCVDEQSFHSGHARTSARRSGRGLAVAESPSSRGTSEGIVDSGNNPTRKGRRGMKRTKEQDAQRKRQARKKQREAKATVVNKREVFESKRERALNQQVARLKE